jgi:hypothetical protein
MIRSTAARGMGALISLLCACGGVRTEVPDANGEPDIDAAGPDAATCAQEPDGLRARWSGENDTDEETGQYPGTANGSLAYTSGRHGTAFSLDGGATGVSADPGDALWPVGSFTVELWMRSTVSDEAYTALIQKYGCGGSDACDGATWAVHMRDTGFALGEVRVSGGDGLGVTGTLTPIDDGEWHHLVLVRDVDAEELVLYVDGALEASTALTADFGDPMGDFDGAPDPVTIGAGRTSGVDTLDYGLVGAIDEPAFYISAWSAEEVAAVYAAPDGICR